MIFKLLTGFAFASVLAGSAAASTVECDIIVQSATGGELEVFSGQTVPGAPRIAPPTIIWRPASNSRQTQLMVAYEGSTLTALGEPSGVHIRFPIEENATADSGTIVVTSPNGRTWRFVGQALERGSNDRAYVEFGENLVYGRALLGAISTGQDLTISVDRYDRIGNGARFASANLRARDALLALAKRKFDAADPESCRTVP